MAVAKAGNSCLSTAFSPEQRGIIQSWGGEESIKRAALVAQINIDQALDGNKLQSVIKNILASHQWSATAFDYTPGLRGLRRVRLDAIPPLSWHQYELKETNDSESALSQQALTQRALTQQALTQWIDQLSSQPLALDKGELFRFGLVRLRQSHYALIVVSSPVAIDRSGLQILLQQIVAQYTSDKTKHSDDVFVYQQYVEWRQSLEDDEDAETGKHYWTHYLASQHDCTPPKLGFKKHIPACLPVAEKKITANGVVDTALATALSDVANSIDCSLTTLLQGAWWLLLTRLSGFNAFIAGWQHDCRADYEVMADALGVFEKVLPVVVDIDEHLSFKQWLVILQNVLNEHTEAQEYWSIDNADVNAQLDVGFVCYDTTLEKSPWCVVSLPGAFPCFELSLMVEVQWHPSHHSIDSATLSVLANEWLYSTAAIERLLDQYQTLLQSIVKHPDQSVSTLTVVSERERKLLLGINNHALAIGNKSISECIADWATLTPGAPAIIMGEQRWDYHELNTQANRTAHWLIQQGVLPGTLVGINLPRSPQLIVAMLAAWRAGAGYLPLDPDWPQERKVSVLTDAAPAIVLDTEILAKEDDTLWKRAAISEIDLQNMPDSLPAMDVEQSAIAYVLYTSGSTGKPKGVVTEHRHLLNYVAAASDAMCLATCRRWALISPVVADVGNTALFDALFNGASLVIADADVVNDGQAFSTFIQSNAIDALKIVPSHLDALLEVEKPQVPKTVILGGEAPSPALIARIQAIEPQSVIFNHYGPTETTVGVVVHRVEQGAMQQVVPLTRVLANNQLYVLDKHRQLVPSGGLGELCISGAQVCRGYLNRAKETGFEDNPFQSGERLYLSGDLAYVLPEGGICLAGRSDHQVKIRGFRVEPAEIETAVQSLPDVHQCAVLAISDSPGDVELAAFIIAESNTEITEQSLRESLQTVLPAYMQPHGVYFLSQFPRLGSGKIDRVGLASLAEKQATQRTLTPPRNATESVIAGCMVELLTCDSIGIDDNFFALGGHSLLVIKLAARIRKQLHVDIPPGMVFDYPTVAELANALQIESNNTAESDQARIPALSASERASSLPLSYAQARLWFLWHMDPDSTAYHSPKAIKLIGKLDEQALRNSFIDVVVRQQSLRTIFFLDENAQARQRILHPDSVTVPLSLLDLTQHAADKKDQLARQEIERLHKAPFHLTSGQLLRIGLLRTQIDEHILIVIVHHIISDGWSTQVLIDELIAHYRARVLSESRQLPELLIQYTDYAIWQRNWLQSGELDRQLDYWKMQLGNEHPVLQLMTDHPRRADAGYQSARYDFELSKPLISQLQQQARSAGATVFMMLLAGFQILLHRYTGQRDIRVGTTNANRYREEVESLIGFFVNTQVLRSDIDSTTSLQTLLNQVRAMVAGAQSHQDLPFEYLVQALQPERSLSHNPLFQVMFNYQRTDMQMLQQLPDLTLERYTLAEQAAQFELTLDIQEDNEGWIQARLRYARELFDAATIERMANHYINVLETFADSLSKNIGDIKLLSQAERYQLQAWSANTTCYSNTLPIHQLFEQRVKEQPKATALVFNNETLSYCQLNDQANRLAHHLIELGVRPESKVGIAMERSIDMVVGLLAILKAGGAYVPLDPAYPSERLLYMIQDSGVGSLLTHSTLIESLPVTKPLTIIEMDWLVLHDQPAHNPSVAIHTDHLAYVIYTSGSTGKPKGTQLCHHNVTRLLQATEQWFHFGPDDVWALFHSYAFDVSVWELFAALCTGGSLVVVPFWISRSPEDFLQLLHEQGVTILNQTPSAFNPLIQLPETYKQALCLRTVIFAGEALNLETLKPWLAHFGDERPQLINMYGITETTVHTTYHRITTEDVYQHNSSIGVPIADLGIRVLDEALNLTPIGVAGELHVLGDGLSRGYLNRASLTAQRFVADPYSDKGQRLYRSGDLARWNNAGQLEYLGRIDHQVKIRGFRIELGEIEAQLLIQPTVREAVVIAQHSSVGMRLIGYITTDCEEHEQAYVDSATLRERLGKRLPDYMLPSVIMALQSLPLTPNGKIDRKALPTPDFNHDKVYEPPQGEVEKTLAQIWASTLDVERVGRQDNFFELGGHSLLALTLLERMRPYGWSTPVRTVFKHPGLSAFAQAIMRGDERQTIVVPGNGIAENCKSIQPEMVTLVELTVEQIKDIEATVPGGAANIQDIYPLAPLQEGMLFHHLWQTQGDAYITFHTLSFDTKERLERFISHFNRIIARHDILRTAILWEGLTEPVQVVYRQAELTIRCIELDANNERDIFAQLNRQVNPNYYRIDVRRAPMIHAIAASQPEQQRCLLQLAVHHLVSDHTTLDVAIREMALMQQGREAELIAPLPFRQFVAEARLTVSQEAHEAFFTDMLGDVDEPCAPFDQLGVLGGGTDIDEYHMPLAEPLARQVRQQARHYGVSTAAIFHLAWALVVGKTSGRDDAVFGTVLFGRLQGSEGAERALGMFINTLPLRIKLYGQSVEQALQQTQLMLMRLLQHEHASLALAQRCSALPGGTALFSTLLNYRYNQQQEAGDDNNPWEGMQVLSGRERTNYPVALSVDDLADGFNLVAQVSDVLDASRICGFVQAAVQAITDALSDQPHYAISELSILSRAEQSQIHAWGTGTVYHLDTKPVFQLFEQKVKVQPKTTALVFNDEVVSYATLNTRANQLAHHLIGLGIKPETKVGIAVERSIEMVVGLLGILKSGATYVPLDPEYPTERLEYIIDDSGIELLLIQSNVKDRLPVVTDLTELALDKLALDDEPEQNPDVNAHSEHLAYVIYTSGSTGRPKGVAIQHSSLTHCMTWMQRNYDLTIDDAVLHKAPFGFDVSVWEIFWPLTAGVRLVLARPGDHRDPDRIIELIREHQITTLNFVPAMFQAFLARKDIEKQTQLRYVMCGGEAVPASLQAEAAQRLKGLSLQNLYGPTETTIHVTSWACQNDGRSLLPIGRPIAETTAYVLDEALDLVPQGIIGELYIGGQLLARGYLNRQSLTCKRFVANPFSHKGERLYRTGDLVRWNKEGQLEYQGRIDHQVKIRGFRVELGEVEAQLLAQTEVREAITIANHSARGVQLVAYVSIVRGCSIDHVQLRDRIAQTLPEYMVPSAIVALHSLPLNANGKVDRKALPEPDIASDKEYEPLHNELEKALAAIWAQVLDIEQVGRCDNFFDLGGHSLLAIRIVDVIRKQVDGYQQLTLNDLYSGPTVREIALQHKADKGLVCLNAMQSNVPALILIHDGYGSILDYTDLSAHFKKYCAIYALTYHSESSASQCDSLYSLAKTHAHEIISAGIKPPYRLLGWSFGGTLAPLIAAVLANEGHDVEFVGAIDPYVRNPAQQQNVDDKTALMNFIASLVKQHSEIKAREKAQLWQKITQLENSTEAIGKFLDALFLNSEPDLWTEHAQLGGEALGRVFIAGRELTAMAQAPIDPIPLNIPTCVWWAQNRPNEEQQHFESWLKLHVIHHTISGNHYEAIRLPQTLQSITQTLENLSV